MIIKPKRTPQRPSTAFIRGPVPVRRPGKIVLIWRFITPRWSRPPGAGRATSHHWLPAAHSTAPELLSVGYARCEPFNDRVLIGNLQIDQSDEGNWRDPAKAQILLKRKNLYQALVAETVHHVLARGYKDIMFQCGDAVSYSQEFDRRMVTITPANLPRFQRQYEKALANFAGARVGDRQRLSRHPGRKQDIVYARDAETLKTYTPDWNAGINYNQFLPWLMATQFYVFPNSSADNALQRAGALYLQGDAHGLCNIIDHMFNDFKITVPGAEPEKLAALRKICQAGRRAENKLSAMPLPRFLSSRGGAKFLTALGGYLRAFGYEDKFLARYTGVKKIPLTARTGAKALFINLRMKARLAEYQRAGILAPQAGKAYVAPEGDEYNFLFDWQKITPEDKVARTISWYERELPAALTQLKLSYQRVRVTAVSGEQYHAWKIIAGLEEFQTQPRELFARRPSLNLIASRYPNSPPLGKNLG